jgi:hypothetical protein
LLVHLSFGCIRRPLFGGALPGRVFPARSRPLSRDPLLAPQSSQRINPRGSHRRRETCQVRRGHQ